MSREKSVWFAEEILLDAKLINFQLEAGELNAVEEMLRAEAQLSRDTETGRLRPKKASEYTLRLITEVLHIMKLDIEEASFNISTLAVAEQCLRLIRSCAASGMKIQTYISKDLSILDDMLSIFTEYQNPNEEILSDELLKKFDSCMIALTQTLGNLVVNNPFNQTIIWDKFGGNLLNALIGQNEKIASCAAMIVYNILLGQPNVLPDDVLLLNALAYMYTDGNSEFPHLIIEYLIGVENSYIEKLYNRLEPETRLLILNLAYNILMSVEAQDINVSVNFIKFIAHEFKVKSDCILKTVDKYVNSIEPQEVVYLLDIIATASSMEAYMECLQSDASLFINCSFLLRSIHILGKQEGNFFASINKLYQLSGRTVPERIGMNMPQSEAISPDKGGPIEEQVIPGGVKKCDSADMLQSNNETVSECTESESSEQYFECTDQLPLTDKMEQNIPETLQSQIAFVDNKIDDVPMNVAPSIIPEKVMPVSFPRQASIDRKISETGKIDESFIKVAFGKNLITDIQNNSGIETIANIKMTEPNLQKDPILNRKVSMDHKIDILEEMEPPLITDSPEDVKQIESNENTPVISRQTSVDVQPRKESIGAQFIPVANVLPSNAHINAKMTRQQSVEPAVEASETVIREMNSEINIRDSVDMGQSNVQPVMNVQIIETIPQSIPGNLAVVEVPEAPVLSPPKVASEPIPVKKSQNVSTEFDLSEQLQKILGISADKAMRSDSLDATKESQSVQNVNAKMETPLHLSQSLTTSSLPAQNLDTSIQKPKIQMKIPNVKIDSPESQRSKLGNFEHTGPKKLTTTVESVEQHVAFGFKATLIRTLGNLCWKNQLNKRHIRELEVIPLLLDCCNIDARNPLIIQWVVLAVRNLCENCPENQAVISSITLREPVNNEVLNEMGLTLHTDADNNTIKIVPLVKN